MVALTQMELHDTVQRLRKVAKEQPWSPLSGAIPDTHRAKFTYKGYLVKVQVTWTDMGAILPGAPPEHPMKRGWMVSVMKADGNEEALPPEVAEEVADLFLPANKPKMKLPSIWGPNKNHIFLEFE
jgi:hypothetical protein